jgi:hypothetical protein
VRDPQYRGKRKKEKGKRDRRVRGWGHAWRRTVLVAEEVGGRHRMVVEEMVAGLGEEDVNRRRSNRGHRGDLHASGGALEGG